MFSMLTVRRRMAVLASAWLVLAGCGSRTHVVEGKVVWNDGKDATELAGGLVVFEAVEEQVSAQGQIRPDATFRLTTYRENDGALAGKHRVVLAPPPERNPDAPGRPLLPRRYLNPEASGLEVVIEPGRNPVTLTLERPGRQ